MSSNEVNFTLVDTEKKLNDMCSELDLEKILAIDLECENNLHHYGAYISLIQVSTPKKRHFIVDIIALKTMGKLKAIFEDESIQKIFHDISFDLRILGFEFDCHPKNIFDSELAAVFLSKQDIGLGSLLAKYFGFEKKKKYQMADWTKRPLSADMLLYASTDTVYLIGLRKQLIKELKEKNLYKWFEEELDFLEEKKLIHKEPDYYDIKGFSKLSDVAKTILKNLFTLREKIAKKTDKPPHFIMNNRKMIEIAKAPPLSIATWQKISGVHPAVKRQAKLFFDTVNRSKSNVEKFPVAKSKRYNQEQRNHFALLNRVREKIAKKTGLKAHLILNKDQMQDIVLTNELNSLRNWQKKLVEEEL